MNDCMGVPVRYDSKMRSICESRGLWRWKRIFVGPQFLRFAPGEQAALMLHEAAHCRLRHLEKRLSRLWLLLFSPSELARFCRDQEFEADEYCRRHGYGADLASAFERIAAEQDPLHPPVSERILRLRATP